MVPMSTTEKNFAEKKFFVSTFLDSYKDANLLLQICQVKYSRTVK